jgi:hypothetical protein
MKTRNKTRNINPKKSIRIERKKIKNKKQEKQGKKSRETDFLKLQNVFLRKPTKKETR